MDFCLAQLIALLGLGRRLCIAQSEQQHHRQGGQQIDRKGEVPILHRYPPNNGRSKHQREVIHGRRDTELLHSRIARKVTYHQTRRVGHSHTCANTHHTTRHNQQSYILGKYADNTTRKKYQQPHSKQLQRLAALGEPTCQQHKRNDEQRWQRGEHLNFEL